MSQPSQVHDLIYRRWCVASDNYISYDKNNGEGFAKQSGRYVRHKNYNDQNLFRVKKNSTVEYCESLRQV